MTCHVARSRSPTRQPPVGSAPGGRVSHLYSPHAIQNRLPEVSETRKWFLRHPRLVQHLPHTRKLHERSRPALARHKSVPAPDQLKESLFPGLQAHFDVNPGIELRAFEKIRGYTGRFPAGFFRATGYRLHHAAVTAAANGESVLGQRAPQDARLFIVRVTLARPRTPHHSHDQFFPHLQFSISLRVFVFPASLRRRHVELLDHRHAQPSHCLLPSIPFPPS